MSSNFVTPGQAYDHTLLAVKGYVPDYPLDVRGRLNSTVDLTVVTPHAGRVVYPASTATLNNTPFTTRGNKIRLFSMGCAGDKKGPPIWLWAGAYDSDISNKGTPSGTATVGSSTYGPPNWVSTMPGRDPANSDQIWGLVGFAGLELETTEFDSTQTYVSGQFLRAVTLDNDANGGVVTNQNASGGAALATTAAIANSNIHTDTIVGQVGLGSYKNSYDRSVLNLYSCFLPGTR